MIGQTFLPKRRDTVDAPEFYIVRFPLSIPSIRRTGPDVQLRKQAKTLNHELENL
jgi:hypothetical protein